MISLVIMAVSGLLLHFLKELARIFIETKKKPTPIQYWREHPYQTAICVISCVVGFVVFQDMGQLNNITAFTVGYMSNSIADVIGKRGLSRI